MFNLDQSISDWRRRMLAGGVKSPNVLDELESHLREDVARQAQAGIGAEEAFEAAARRIGEAHALKTEFAKAGRALESGRSVTGRACVVFLVGLILFVSGETILRLPLSLGEQMAAFAAVAFTLAVACGWRYAAPYVPVTAIRQGTMAVGSACSFYFKAAAFLMPAALVWLCSALFVMPKLSDLCQSVGMTLFNFPGADALFRAWEKICQVLVFLTAHDFAIACAAVLGFILLEWRSNGWRRYRRATVGAGIFLFNFAVLLSLMLMVISAIVASSCLTNHVK
jgi:hypothetical protein